MIEQQRTTAAPPPSFLEEFPQVWARIPLKRPFLIMLGAWLLFFQFFGSSVMGYLTTPSLYRWMNRCYYWFADDQIGYLIPVVVLVLLWWKREELLAVPTRTWWPALVLVVLGLMVHILGFVVQQQRVSLLGFFLGMYGLTGLVWGPQLMRAIFFPYFLFVFSYPIGNTTTEQLSLPLRVLATKISVAFSHGVLGINVIRQGTMIFEPSGKFQYEVAAACGGLRSLKTFIIFTTIFGCVYLRSNWRRSLVIASALPLAVLSNVIRLLCIIVAAEACGRQAGNWVHESSWFSLLPYLPSLATVLMLGAWLREKPRKEGA